MKLVVVQYKVKHITSGEFVRQGVELDAVVFERTSVRILGRAFYLSRVVVYLKPLVPVLYIIPDGKFYGSLVLQGDRHETFSHPSSVVLDGMNGYLLPVGILENTAVFVVYLVRCHNVILIDLYL